jgi:NDP-sugar pyrophosphorylase family protein
MKGMILAAGLGTRMKPLSDFFPKPLIEIASKPLIYYSIKNLEELKIEEIVINVHYMGDSIKSYIQNDKEFSNLEIIFSDELKILGSSGAIKKVENVLKDDIFILINSDMLFDIDIDKAIKFHVCNEADITLCLAVDSGSGQKFGTIGVDENNRIIRYLSTSISEKEEYTTIFKGIHIISPKIFEFIPPDIYQDFSRHTYPAMLKQGFKIMGYITKDYWQPVGDLSEYKNLLMDIMNNRISFKVPFPMRDKEVFIANSAEISSSVKFIHPVIIGSDSVILDSCVIGPKAVIGSSCLVEDNSTIDHSVVYSNAHIYKNSQIHNKIWTSQLKLDF